MRPHPLPNGRAPLTAAERASRAVALTVAEASDARSKSGQKPAPAIETRAPPLAEAAAEASDPAGDCRCAPVVTITIAGPPGSGKSVIAHLIRGALGREGIACAGPDGLRSLNPRRALASLIDRGLSVELVKVETVAGGER